MKRFFKIFVCTGFIASTATVLGADVPPLINYQGRLSNADGSALVTSDYALSFSVYDSAQNGSIVWGPQIFDGATGIGHGPRIPVVQGYFNTMLGPDDTNQLSLAKIFSVANRYIEIKVGTNGPILPRQQVLSTPYALNAGNSETLHGFDWTPLFGVNNPSGFLQPSKIDDGSLPASKIRPGSISAVQLASSGILPIVTAWGNTYPFSHSLLPKYAPTFDVRSRRVGDTMEVQATFVFTTIVPILANVDGGAMSIGLPADVLIDGNKVPGAEKVRVVCGSWKHRSAGGGNYFGVCWIGLAAAGNYQVNMELDGSRIASNEFNVGDTLAVKFEYPVIGWAVTN